MVTKHSQPKRCFLSLSAKLLTMLLGMLFFAGLALTQTGEKQIRVEIYSYQRTDDGKSTPLGNVTVKIGPSTVTTDASGKASTVVPRGEHNVKAYLQGFIVADISVYPDALGGTHGGGPAKSAEGDLDLPFLYNSYDEESKSDSTLGVYLKPGDQQKKDDGSGKEVALAAVAEDCKDFDWENTSIRFMPPGETMPDGRKGYPISAFGKERRFELSKYGMAQNKTELKPGTYDVNIHIPSDVYAPPLPIEEEGDAWRPWAKLSKVEVYRAFPKLELVNTYQGNEMGFAVVQLDASLWTGTSVPYVKVYVEKLCDLPYVTVDLFSGGAEVTRDGEVQSIQAGMRLRRNDKIKTEPGSLVQLKSEGGVYLIKIGGPEKVELNMGAVITGAGRKFIVPYLKTGKVQIERIGGPKKRGKETPPESELPPVPGPDDPAPETGISVNTPTATATPNGTNYTVNYDEKTGVTTVGVEEGEVEVTPTNSSLQPLTLAANQQVQVSKSSVGAITSYSGAGGKTGRILLYVGIGLASLLALFSLLYFFRRQHRRAMQPAFYPPGARHAGANAPASDAPPPVNSGPQRCPNQRCGKDLIAGEKFCAHCGTLLIADAPASSSINKHGSINP